MQNPSRPDNPADTLKLLATRARNGDREAFEQLLKRYDPGLKQVLLRRTGGRLELAEEIAQRTWIAVWEALHGGRYDPEQAALSTFAYAVAHKIWLQHIRKSSGEPTSFGMFETPPEGATADAENPAALLQAAESLDALRECLKAEGTPFSLTPEERKIIVELSQGTSERALAEEFNLAPSTIHARKTLAHKKLRNCLKAKGFSPESPERRET